MMNSYELDNFLTSLTPGSLSQFSNLRALYVHHQGDLSLTLNQGPFKKPDHDLAFDAI